jgi:hypothetical protein
MRGFANITKQGVVVRVISLLEKLLLETANSLNKLMKSGPKFSGYPLTMA